MLTAQQIELLHILQAYGPLTRQAIGEMLWLKGSGAVGDWQLRNVGKRLCTLERLGLAEGRYYWDIPGLRYCQRYRKLWMITYQGCRQFINRQRGGL